jgi:hypothetical protein
MTTGIMTTLDGRRFILLCPCGRQVYSCPDPACRGMAHPMPGDDDHRCPFLVEDYDVPIETCTRRYLEAKP